MALSGLDIYRLLPKTNCRECGFATCLVFAMQLAKKAVSIDKCPSLSKESRAALEASAQPPIKLVTLGIGEAKFEAGNESVMFRHEEKFHRPCGIGFIIEDSLSNVLIKDKIIKINKLKFERIGQKLEVNLVAIKQKESAKRFTEVVKLVADNTSLALVLMSDDLTGLKQALDITANRKPLIYHATKENLPQIAELAKDYNAALVATGEDLDAVSGLTVELNNLGISELILETGDKPIAEKIWDLTQMRRLALKKNNRSLGYPSLVVINQADPFEEAQEAASYIAKYAGIVLIKGVEPFEILPLVTLRQNIYSDPQKPLQIEPKLYPIGQVNDKSPVLVTTNFSLTYYTVLGEVEASKIPSYIVSVDTEGMSVLTAWAAEKFTPHKITESINKLGVKDAVKHKRLIIPGYVAVISGELEDESGFEIIVGPKEAAGIPSFLKNLPINT
ncbi:MAG: acetyl-CoA decarbonylase/synthase complex subunit gamma [Candidatus Omnitrophica bacterium CG08_land_8_20_14_0_20_41_16]|uniref:Acetyl-CoA decarbonylase/synthase complex subunit gamma n=1 Tax=Candidatus Sherwoodlollariibacterium unditelluris TaxID=1974757 RepID=A0A2G9YI80_9BACT|nr:MAG: acetyl-CoA decarbonylase/synthase complex subunit gamma [Candidatus Omnitrophica bacterium CG23_combo_of_CG06-09_8_20_14_all_41_10]PIS33551.1 MAG: acetyl-CoA decarbonylase/synthase complex subunit gamma [Candidatus Omnitrophica bacterium CG08_land_8_20_14_0_20_41_16]